MRTTDLRANYRSVSFNDREAGGQITYTKGWEEEKRHPEFGEVKRDIRVTWTFFLWGKKFERDMGNLKASTIILVHSSLLSFQKEVFKSLWFENFVLKRNET